MSTINRYLPLQIKDLVGLSGTGREGSLPINCVPYDSNREQWDGDTPAEVAGEYVSMWWDWKPPKWQPLVLNTTKTPTLCSEGRCLAPVVLQTPQVTNIPENVNVDQSNSLHSHSATFYYQHLPTCKRQCPLKDEEVPLCLHQNCKALAFQQTKIAKNTRGKIKYTTLNIKGWRANSIYSLHHKYTVSSKKKRSAVLPSRKLTSTRIRSLRSRTAT